MPTIGEEWRQDQRDKAVGVLFKHAVIRGKTVWMCNGCTWDAPLSDDDSVPARHQVDELTRARLI